MIDHMTFGVADLARSMAFYDAVFAPLGIQRMVHLSKDQAGGVALAAYGRERPQFWLAEERATQGMLHVAFEATTRAQVSAFHEAAMKAGGRDNGAPGLRPQYHDDYFGAFVLDPDGHNIEAVCHLPDG